jgi:hypothetical protein
MRGSLVFLATIGCGDNLLGKTPELVAVTASEGQHVEVIGTVHAVTFDSTQPDMVRRMLLDIQSDPINWVLEQDDEEKRGGQFAYDDTGAHYPRTPDHYILLRSVVPQGQTLAEAWGLGIHLTDIDPAQPMPELGSLVHVTGTFHRVMWNQRFDDLVPILDDAEIEIQAGPPPLLGPGESCSLDQQCNARLICDRASRMCSNPPREIYWADPFRDVNGACDTDMDCPLGQHCDASYSILDGGDFGAHYFATADVGRHVCLLDTGANPTTQCPRIYDIKDVIGGRFASGKEICVRATLLSPVHAEDNDTHDQMIVDEPIPYPTSDIAYNLFGGTTENGPIYKHPMLPGGPIVDPQPNQEVIAIGTYRYDPDHGWYEVHPVKGYFPTQ